MIARDGDGATEHPDESERHRSHDGERFDQTHPLEDRVGRQAVEAQAQRRPDSDPIGTAAPTLWRNAAPCRPVPSADEEGDASR